MARRLSYAEKGKALATSNNNQPKMRIKAPEVDTSELIKANDLTLAGRLTNQQAQNLWSLFPVLSRRWNLQGKSHGSDLGNGRFQFRFENEEDLNKVLANRPYHFSFWMVILQKWEPILADSFPSMIPFWIQIQGLPLHYWLDKVVRDIGNTLGHLETHELTSSSARIRVLINALQPLVKETIMEFSSGEEVTLTFKYERLEKHCTICNRLTHENKDCPNLNQSRKKHYRSPSPPLRNKDRHTEDSTRDTHRYQNPRHRDSTNEHNPRSRDYHHRVDRHGRLFGERTTSKNFKERIDSDRQSSEFHNSAARKQSPPRRMRSEQRHDSENYQNRRLPTHGQNFIHSPS